MESRKRPNHCVLEYLYRDGGNWKTYGEALLMGEFSPDLSPEIKTLLGGDCLFVPEQVGLSPLQDQHTNSYGDLRGLNHAFHEFVRLRPAEASDLCATPAITTIDQFIGSLRNIDQNWNCGLSPYA